MSDLQTLTEPEAPRRAREKRFAALAVLMVAGIFCGVIIGVMMATRAADMAAEDLREHTVQYAKTLQADSGDEDMANEALLADASVRERFWTNRTRLAAGVVLLLIGAVALVVAARYYAAHDTVPPEPGSPIERGDPDLWLAGRRHGLAALAVGMLLVFVVASVLAVVGGADLPAPAAPSDDVAVVTPVDTPVEDVVSAPFLVERSEFLKHWPSFRGPNGTGIVPAGDYVTEWDGEAGTNVIWKTEVPLSGTSSPVTWGDRIFLTGAADKDTQEVFCFDRAGGELLWRTPVKAERDWDGRIQMWDDTGYAAPTPVVDGERVYAWFASADLFALDFDGNVVWSRNLGKPDNMYGISSSLVFHRDALIVQFDQGDTAQSRMLFIEPRTGRAIVSIPRDFQANASWASPIVTDTPNGARLLTACDPFVVCYDPAARKELWRIDALTGDVGPSPTYADGIVYTTNDFSQVSAIKIGGSGELDGEEWFLWTADVGMSDASSPLCDGTRYLQVHSSNGMSCYDAKSGELLWEHFLDKTVWASPTLVGDTVYLPALDGVTLLFSLGAEYEEPGTASLGEDTFATPAFLDGRIYMRGVKHLFCIGKEAE